MKLGRKNTFLLTKWIVVFLTFEQTVTIYVPNEIDQTPKRYTTGLKIKTSHYKTLTEPYYHSNYSKVYVHNKNYTSSLLDSSSDGTTSTGYGQSIKVYPVYMSDEKKEKIKNVLKDYNTNVIEKDILNNKVVFKRRIEKTKNIEVYNKCPKGVTGQFVYDVSCNQYLDCWSGRGGPRNCAPGTLFNPKTLECDFPEKVECLTGPTANSLTLQRSAKLQNYEQAKCPKDFSGLIPNYSDCSKFIQCNSGIQTKSTCPPGTLFDINLNVCNHPRETTCFSGQSGTAYAVKEQSGGSTDTSGHVGQYQSQTGQLQGHAGQYQSVTELNQAVNRPYLQTGQYQTQKGQNSGQYPGQGGQYHSESGQYGKQTGYDASQGHTSQFLGQTNYQGQGESRDSRQYQGTTKCDPTSLYCNSGGYVISGQNIYRNPPVTQGATTFGGSATGSNYGQGTHSYGSTQTQGSRGTVYIQYVMCNPVAEDCSRFQQGTFILGPGGTLCNPITQNCNVTQRYVPSTKMRQQTTKSTVPSSGVYYIKYVMCNSLQEDCSRYQKGIIEATYGIPGTLVGVQPVTGTSQGTKPDPTAECNPQINNCDSIQYQTQGRPQISTYDQISSGQGAQATIGSGSETHSYGQGLLPPNSQSQYPKKFGSTTNYKKVCNAGEGNCYPAGTGTSTRTYDGSHRGKLAEAKCPDGFQGITKHPTNCKKFLNCANGITYVQDCAPGTLFNPFILTCDFPYNVDCKNGEEEVTTTEYFDIVEQTGPYDKILVRTPPSPINNACQGSQCIQDQSHLYQNQYGGSQNQNQYGGSQNQNQDRTSQGHTTVYGQTDCQGLQCQGQGQIEPGQSHLQGQLEGGFGQQQGNCQGSTCVYRPQGQTQGLNYGNQQAQGGCQGSQCVHIPQGSTSTFQGQNCRGSQCETRVQGFFTPSEGSGIPGIDPRPSCQGYNCNREGTFQGLPSTDIQGSSVQDNKGQTSLYQTTTRRTYSWPTRVSGRPDQVTQGQTNQGYISQGGGSSANNENSHVMKIPLKNPGVTPINKSDRITSGGFNNQGSVDYVDIFDPDESRNFGYATTTKRSAQKAEKQVWPPPFPDLVATDPDADYVFEYEDGEPVTLSPEKVTASEKKKKTRCGSNDFVCDQRSCVEKSFVCDGVKDCDDGKDEKYCEKYLIEYKVYKNSRLDVLERQRWDNVSQSTCALLCMDSQKFECKSFNYRKYDRTCFLTNENIGSSGSLKSFYPCDYYERNSASLDCSDMHKCPNGKCLTSDAVCDGYDDCGDRADERGCRADDFGYQVRLNGGEGDNEGRVEVTVFGKTGYICDDQFSMTDADVLCKELGFYLGAAEVKGNSYYAKDLKENHTLYMMDDIQCLGNETSIMHCDFAGWGIHNCADKEIAGVVCKTPEETCSEGFWKCDTGNECVKLPFLCDDLDDCTDNSDEASHHCNSPTELRLVNGTKNNEGRLEIRHHGIWGSICDDDFNEDAAKIVCKHLGYYGSAFVKKDAYFGQSNGPIWLDQVSCFGNESSLEKCTHWEWGSHNCDHSEDVGIVCSNEFMEVDAQRSSKFGGGASGSIKNSATSYSPEPVNCGYRKDNIFLEHDDVHFRVVQGSIATPGDYPWQAALRIQGQDKTAHWCGAVVIAFRWVLTAAHCLEGYPKGAYVVVAGEYNIDENEGTEQQVYIDEYYLHERFRQGHKMGNDIAMIKLKGHGFKLNQDIQPICLPDETSNYERDFLNCTVSGFGTIQTGKSAYSHKLRAAWIPIQKMDVCKMAHIYGENIGAGMICAGDINGGGDACDGDSGGPLACLQDGVFTLYGLTSWGQRCGYANKPGVYVKVSYYKQWIDNIMKLHS